eukprot:2430921-Amphidinium_carterae.1
MFFGVSSSKHCTRKVLWLTCLNFKTEIELHSCLILFDVYKKFGSPLERTVHDYRTNCAVPLNNVRSGDSNNNNNDNNNDNNNKAATATTTTARTTMWNKLPVDWTTTIVCWWLLVFGYCIVVRWSWD